MQFFHGKILFELGKNGPWFPNENDFLALPWIFNIIPPPDAFFPSLNFYLDHHEEKTDCYNFESNKGPRRYSSVSVPDIMSGILLTMWRHFFYHLVFWPSECDSHLKGKSKNLQYVRVRVFSQILAILVVHSLQFFISFLKYEFFWNRTKIDIFMMFFP